jgi:hypothetical protein
VKPHITRKILGVAPHARLAQDQKPQDDPGASPQAKGGHARAAALDAAQRRSQAQHAANSRWGHPVIRDGPYLSVSIRLHNGPEPFEATLSRSLSGQGISGQEFESFIERVAELLRLASKI